MAAGNVNYGTASIQTERNKMGRSNILWNSGRMGFNILRLLEDSNIGDFSHEQFMAWVGGAVASHANNYFGNNGGWHSLEGGATAGSITTLATDFPNGVTNYLTPPGAGLALGAIELATGAAAHNSCAMEAGGSANGANANGMYSVPPGVTVTTPSAGQYPVLAFEARVRFPQTTNAGHFIGMCAPNQTSAMNTLFNASDVAQKVNAIGFWVTPVATTGFATSATKIQPGYATSANFTVANQTGFTGSVGGIPSTTDYTNIVPSGVTINPAVASTDWTKLGFIFDANTPGGLVLRFYQDGILLASQTLAQLVAANWPSDVQLTPTLYVQSTGAGGATAKLDVDWVDVGIMVAGE